MQGKWLECAGGLSCPPSPATILVPQLGKATKVQKLPCTLSLPLDTPASASAY